MTPFKRARKFMKVNSGEKQKAKELMLYAGQYLFKWHYFYVIIHTTELESK